MSILTQLLIIALVLALFYAVIINNREVVKHIIGQLPDFSKIFSKQAPHQSAYVKVVVFVPDAHAEEVRKAVGDTGGGHIGHYTHCSFSSQGIGRFKPEHGAHPAIGSVGNPELVEEERIEFVVSRADLPNILAVIRRVHPYEEPATDIYPLEDFPTTESNPQAHH